MLECKRCRHAGERRPSASLGSGFAVVSGICRTTAAAAILSQIDTSRLTHIVAAHLRNTTTRTRAERARDVALGCGAGLGRHRRSGNGLGWRDVQPLQLVSNRGHRPSRGRVVFGSVRAMEPRQEPTRKAKTVTRSPDVRATSSCITATTCRRSICGKARQAEQKGETNNKINAFVMASSRLPESRRTSRPAERARIAGRWRCGDSRRMRRSQYLRGLDGQAR